MNFLDTPHNKIKLTLFTFLFAFLFRFSLYYFQIFDTWGLTGDSQEYINIAKSIKDYGVIGENGEPGMNRTPGYPFLIFFSFIFSEEIESIIYTQFFIDALTCVMVMDIAYKINLQKKYQYLLSILLTSCLYTTIYSGMVMTETLYCFLITFSFWILNNSKIDKEFLFDLSILKIFILSFTYASIILVRPIFSIVLFISFILFFFFDIFNSNKIKIKIISKYFLITILVFSFLSPWVIRNLNIFSKYYEYPNNDIITPIGFKTNYNMWKVVYNKNYQKFVKSYNEPLLILNPVNPPVVSKKVYSGEKKDIEEVFLLLQKIPNIKNGRSNYPLHYSKQINDKFRTISEKRYNVKPSLHITAPLSRLAKILFAPRISSFYKTKSGFNTSKVSFFFYIIYNAIYVLPAILLCIVVALRMKKYRHKTIFLYSFSMIIGHLYVYTSWVPLTQSRYLIPLFPMLSLLSVIFFYKMFSYYYLYSKKIK